MVLLHKASPVCAIRIQNSHCHSIYLLFLRRRRRRRRRSARVSPLSFVPAG